jgi:hypothetical protein
VACNNQVCFLLQMPSRTRAQDGAGTSCGGKETSNPPPVPPMLVEAIAALVNATAHSFSVRNGWASISSAQRQRSTPRPQRYHVPRVFRNSSTSFC